MALQTIRAFQGVAFAGLIILGCGGSPQDESRHPAVDSTADSTRSQLVNCCITPSCDVCVEKFGRCNCLEDLKAGRPVCGQCIEGYKHGKGKLKLISIPEIKKREGT